ncbi:MAG TPA: SUMF1/EgtB/PvdO family nonheme iron enzyme, partial [Polyangiaceae bacterium]|nr:SUMF1/EgtB/PvdO family nonheme iron enzyme [Polyangiaceae bacterium]
IPTLLVDTYEVTVARWREALASGFEPPLGGPARNNIDEPLADSWVYRGPRLCTWSTIPLATYPREDYPINCVLLEDVRAFCEWRGGDLLTEAQWEYVAGAAGRDAESFYPWGNEPPGCEGVVYARQNDENKGGVACQTLGFGPRPVQEGALDVTAHGVRGLAGSVAEWVSDDFRSYRTVCWAAQPLHDPHCVDDSAPHGAVRGGSWVQTVLPAHARTSNAKSAGHIDLGFRCARQVQP